MTAATAKRVSTTSTHIHTIVTQVALPCQANERASYRSIDQWRDPTHFLAAVPETGHFPHCIYARCDCVGCFNCLIVVATHLHTMSHGRLALHDSIHLCSQSYPEYGA